MEKPIIVTAYQQKPDGTLATIIPKPIRQSLGIVKGTRFMAYPQNGSLVLTPIDDTPRKPAPQRKHPDRTPQESTV